MEKLQPVKYFLEKNNQRKHKKDLVIGWFSGYSLPMSSLPFPADSAEFEEYTSVMNAMADEANASAPDPEPESFGGRCEDAPCCGCCGGSELYDSAMEYERQRELYEDAPDDSHLDKDWEECHEDREEPEDRYLDSYWEDQSEYGMEGCCGDF